MGTRMWCIFTISLCALCPFLFTFLFSTATLVCARFLLFPVHFPTPPSPACWGSQQHVCVCVYVCSYSPKKKRRGDDERSRAIGDSLSGSRFAAAAASRLFLFLLVPFSTFCCLLYFVIQGGTNTCIRSAVLCMCMYAIRCALDSVPFFSGDFTNRYTYVHIDV